MKILKKTRGFYYCVCLFFFWNSQCMWLRCVSFQENICNGWLAKLFQDSLQKNEWSNDRNFGRCHFQGCFVVISIYEPENTMPRWSTEGKLCHLRVSFQKKWHWNDMMLAVHLFIISRDTKPDNMLIGLPKQVEQTKQLVCTRCI